AARTRAATRCRPATGSSERAPSETFLTMPDHAAAEQVVHAVTDRRRLPLHVCVLDSGSDVKRTVIAIDGPSGAGKGTIARAVAAELGYRHFDSGAMYRAVGWKAQRDGVRFDDEPAVAALAAASQIDIGGMCVAIDGVDVTREIRTPVIDRAAAAVARLP